MTTSDPTVGLPGEGVRAADGWVTLGIVLLGSLFLWELVSMSGVPIARDMQMFFLPQRHLLRDALVAGRLPLWTPYMGAGAPLLANLQCGAFYPPHWLYALLPFFVAFNLLVVFHFVLGGVGTYALARKLGNSKVAGFATAVTFMLGGYFASLLNLINAQQAAAWIPWLAWTCLHHLDRRAPGSLALLVGVFLMGLLAGEPQTFLLGVVLAGLLTLMRWPSHDSARRQIALAGSLCLAGLLMTGLAMVQLLPTAELIAESSRAGRGLTYDEAAYYSLMPIRLLNLAIPADFRDPDYQFGLLSLAGRTDAWLYSVYLGALAPLFFVFAWRSKVRRLETALFSAVVGVGLLLALGRYTPVYGWLYEVVPGFRAFRFPEKYFLFCGLGTALLTGIGIDSLRARRWSRADLFLALLVLLFLVVLRTYVGVEKEAVLKAMEPHFVMARARGELDYAYRVWVGNLTKLTALWGIGLALTALYRRRVLSEPLFAAGLLMLVTADFVVAHRPLNPTVEAEFYEAEPLITRYLPMEEIRRDYRYRATAFDQSAGAIRVLSGVPLEAQKWLWQQTMQPNTSQLRHVLQIDNWDAVKLRRYQDEITFYRELPDPTQRWRLLRLSSVKYVYSAAPLTEGGYGRETRLDSLPGFLYEVGAPLPRAHVVHAARSFADDEETINGILAAGFDPRRMVALTGAAPLSDTSPPSSDSSTATIVDESGEEIRIRVEVDRPGYLVLNDSYYPGWEAVVDGQARDIRLANYFFRAVAVQPGDQEVVFRYRSRPLERGALASMATLILGVAGLGMAGVRRRGSRTSRT